MIAGDGGLPLRSPCQSAAGLREVVQSGHVGRTGDLGRLKLLVVAGWFELESIFDMSLKHTMWICFGHVDFALLKETPTNGVDMSKYVCKPFFRDGCCFFARARLAGCAGFPVSAWAILDGESTYS